MIPPVLECRPYDLHIGLSGSSRVNSCPLSLPSAPTHPQVHAASEVSALNNFRSVSPLLRSANTFPLMLILSSIFSPPIGRDFSSASQDLSYVIDKTREWRAAVGEHASWKLNRNMCDRPCQAVFGGWDSVHLIDNNIRRTTHFLLNRPTRVTLNALWGYDNKPNANENTGGKA